MQTHREVRSADFMGVLCNFRLLLKVCPLKFNFIYILGKVPLLTHWKQMKEKMFVDFISGKKKAEKGDEEMSSSQEKQKDLQLFKWDRFRRIFKVKDSRECMNY